jgi:cell division protein FtsW (lipid II flippase)
MNRTVSPVIVPLGLIAFFTLLGVGLVLSAPEVEVVNRVTITAPPEGESVVVGWRELGQRPGPRSAEARHLSLSRPVTGWSVANIAHYRKVEVRTTRHDARLLRRWRMEKDDLIRVGETNIRVLQADDETLALRDATRDREMKWEDHNLRFPENEFVYTGNCGQGCRLWRCLKSKISSSYLNLGNERFLFSIGGSVNVVDRWKIPGVPPVSAKIYRCNGEWRLGPGSGNAPVLMAREGAELRGFDRLRFPLSGAEGDVLQAIIGRTYYTVDAAEDKLVLTPVANRDVRPAGEPFPAVDTAVVSRETDKLAWIGAGASLAGILTGRPLYASFAGCMAVFVVLLVVVGHRKVKRRRGVPMPLVRKLLAWVPAALFLGLTGAMYLGAPGLGVLLIVAAVGWAWATVMLRQGGYLTGDRAVLWSLAVCLAGAGAIVLTQLAAGADNTRWVGFASKHLCFLSAFGWAMSVSGAVLANRVRGGWKLFVTEETLGWLRWAPVIFALVFLVAQWGIGSEQGVWGFQPAEAAKLVLVFLSGIVGMRLYELRGRGAPSYQDRFLSYIKDAIRALCFIGFGVVVALWGVNDMSPIIIIAVFGFAWLWKASRPVPIGSASWSGPIIALRTLILMVTAGVIGGALWAQSHPEVIPENLSQRDRLMVWARPEAYPHSGAQVRKAMAFGGRGGWTGAGDSWFGGNGAVMDVPAVQNDFIGSFVLFRFGGLAGLALLLVQLAYAGRLFSIAESHFRSAESAGDDRWRKTGRVTGFVLFGLTWMHLTQWGIAWGNALGLLPVMGQPMTWISAANSHLLFFALPTLVLGMGIVGPGERDH